MTHNKTIKTLRLSVFLFTLLLISATFIIMKNLADPDLWHRMSVGRIFSQLGNVVYHDFFSYLPTKEMWIDHEWLSGVVFYNLGHYFGDYGILTLQVLVLFSVVVLVFATNRLIWPEDKYRISYYLIVLLGIIPGLVSSLRCQAFTYLFFALWLYLLERIRRGETRFVWVFPVTALLWANMHGGFLAGLGLVGFYLAGDFLNKRDITKYIWILALSVTVTLLNPYGIKYWYYLVDAVSMHRPYITEWLPFDPFKSIYNEPGAKLIFLFLFAGYGYKLFKKELKFDFVEIVTLGVTLYLALKHERHVTFFVIAAGCFGYKHFVVFLDSVLKGLREWILSLIPEDRHQQVYFAKHYATYFFLITCGFYLLAPLSVSVKMGSYPTRAIEFIKINNLRGNLMVPFNWGSYAMWKLYPDNLVSVDGRFEEAYKTQTYLDVSHFMFFKSNWDDALKKYKHDIFLISKIPYVYEDEVKDTSGIFDKLKTFEDLQIVYEDEISAVFIPVSEEKPEWKQPTDDEEYYIKTKYENRIDF